MFMFNASGSSPADSNPQSGRLILALRLALLGTGKPALAPNRGQTEQSLGAGTCLLSGFFFAFFVECRNGRSGTFEP